MIEISLGDACDYSTDTGRSMASVIFVVLFRVDSLCALPDP